MTDRFYVVIGRSASSKNAQDSHRLRLEDGSAVICSVNEESIARSLAANSEGLKVRSHSDLNRTEQQRMRQEV